MKRNIVTNAEQLKPVKCVLFSRAVAFEIIDRNLTVTSLLRFTVAQLVDC